MAKSTTALPTPTPISNGLSEPAEAGSALGLLGEATRRLRDFTTRKEGLASLAEGFAVARMALVECSRRATAASAQSRTNSA